MRSYIKSLINFAYTYLKVHRALRRLSELIAICIRPNPNIVLLGAMNGLWYGDNSRHLYEWILQNRPDLNPIWLTKKHSIAKSLKEQKMPVCKLNSLRGFYLLYKAPAGTFTNSLHDIALFPFLIPNRLKLIALRHGRSVKRVRFARLNHKISDKEAIERKRENQLVHAVISTSEFISNIQEECLKIGREKHIVTGYPRNDHLLANRDHTKNLFHQHFPEIKPNHIVLYAPSWRHGRNATEFFPFEDFDQESLFEYLSQNRILLLLRPHANDLARYPQLRSFIHKLESNCVYIKLATHDTFHDVNNILPSVDMLISDYSALYHDFLLLDRPLAFIPYDYSKFEKENGFLYDYFKHLPGPVLKTQCDLIRTLNDLIEQQDTHRTKRDKLKKMVHHRDAPESCQRVAVLIDELLDSQK